MVEDTPFRSMARPVGMAATWCGLQLTSICHKGIFTDWLHQQASTAIQYIRKRYSSKLQHKIVQRPAIARTRAVKLLQCLLQLPHGLLGVHGGGCAAVREAAVTQAPARSAAKWTEEAFLMEAEWRRCNHPQQASAGGQLRQFRRAPFIAVASESPSQKNASPTS